ncbi:Mitochondrial pyruvate carrier 2 [Imshaugia aleurites]|uniref:Mitochondrial pyruvate carrier n=1 Tax=Imshaugia aleurites TaxID=172621 RepID=A0A8H3ESJ2_9LECA|nr:Mitochondrial pyruvate carrier 2 [Imshaugia aleurites]
MSSRAGLRFFQSARFSRAFTKKSLGRRYQTADATAAPAEGILQRLWNSPVGVKTVHFWAPVMKWSIVLAGVSDFARPAESLSLTQNIALTATGVIWTRWCFVIKPRNLLLAAVNFFLGCVGVTQVTRILLYQRSQEAASAGQIVEKDAKDVANTVKGITTDPEGAAQKAVK